MEPELWRLVGVTALRAGAVAGLAVVLALALRPAARQLTPWRLALLLPPVLAPGLLVSYAYGDFALAQFRRPWANELLYILLVACRCAPLAALLWRLAPPPASTPSARHLLKLLPPPPPPPPDGRSPGTRFRAMLDGPARPLGWLALVVWLLAFGEFDLASRLSVPCWSLWLYDAQAGGRALSSTLTDALGPLLVQMIAIALVASALGQGGTVSGALARRMEVERPLTARRRWSAAGVLALCWLALVLIPCFMVLRDTWVGIAMLWGQTALKQGIRHSLLLASAGGAGALLLVNLLPRRRWAWALPLLVPGLCGSLTLGLALLALFQTDALVWGYDTPLPVVLALILLTFPAVWLLSRLLDPVSESPEHLALLLRSSPDRSTRAAGRDLRWTLRWRLLLLIGLLGAWLAYSDLPASALLSPPGLTPAPVWLHNLMHYGRSQVLSAMVAATWLTPLVLVLFFWMLGSAAKRCRRGVNWRHA